jgi:hypothetical protein
MSGISARYVPPLRYARQIATALGGAACLYSRYKALIRLQHTVNGFLNHLFGISATPAGALLDAGFLIRAEMYFHAASVRNRPRMERQAKTIMNAWGNPFLPAGFRYGRMKSMDRLR